MRGSLSEFTLAQMLQFFALAERTGSVTVCAQDRESRLLVEGDRIVGWGLDDFDVRAELSKCSLLPVSVIEALERLVPTAELPGLSFIVRNLVEPERWECFARRQLEQDIYPLLSVEDGEFDVRVQRCPPAPLRLSIPINSLILDGSRWESEMEAAKLGGYGVATTWKRVCDMDMAHGQQVSSLELLVWQSLDAPRTIASVANSLGIPDLETVGVIRRLATLEVIVRID